MPTIPDLALGLCGFLLLVGAGPALAQEFRSPSGNIGCIIYPPGEVDPEFSLRCDIGKYEPSWVRPPDGCTLDWGGTLMLGETGPGLRGCVGDVGARPDARMLDYGETIQAGKISCEMMREGVKCINGEGGFFMSRARQRVF